MKTALSILCLFLLSSPLHLEAKGEKKSRSIRQRSGVNTEKEAKAIAERETGGRAAEARRIPLNGATGGWEVLVHMADEEKGWKCIIDCDTHGVYTKDRIPNPVPKKKRR